MNLAELALIGITARLDDGGELVLSAPRGVITPDIRDQLAAAKPFLVAELSADVNLVNLVNLKSNLKGKPAQDIATPSPPPAVEPVRSWLVKFPDRDPVAVTVVPCASREEVSSKYPGASSVEPWQPVIEKPEAPMTAQQEATVRAWLASIRETNPETISEVLARCETNAGARAYFIKRGKEAEEALMADVAALARAALVEPTVAVEHGRMVGEDG